ncbi:twin-arginine translocation signal domain-containing protein, partial [Haloarcula sp. S1AR25-5A]
MSDPSRRQFLGAAAAAALAGLPQSASAETPDPRSVIEEQSVRDDGNYSITDCGAVPGNLNKVTVE